MTPTQFDLVHKDEYTDGKYTVRSFSSSDGPFRRIICEQESVCVVPFDINEHDSVRNIYLSKYRDHVSDKIEKTCITKTFDRDEFDSYFEAVEAIMKVQLGLSDLNANEVYYLGTVRSVVPFTKEYRCYGVDISKHSMDPSGHATPEIDILEGARKQTIEKIKFTKILNNEVPDPIVLSSALLLLTYLSD